MEPDGARRLLDGVRVLAGHVLDGAVRGNLFQKSRKQAGTAGLPSSIRCPMGAAEITLLAADELDDRCRSARSDESAVLLPERVDLNA